MTLYKATRVLNEINAGAWAITEDALSLIVRIASREGEGLEAVEARLGRPLENSHAVTVRDGVATVPINGPIFRYANLFTAISGGSTIDALATDVQAALENPAIRAILLHIDSPGGQVAGVNELAEMLYAARGRKPITAYVGNQAASAAYWIASAADRIVIDATATAGSIGVIGTMRTPKESGDTLTFVSSQSPRKRPDLATEGGRAQIQQEIDHTADVFVAAVARNRGVSVETVLDQFGQGGQLVGQHAVNAGLADALGSYEQTLATLAQRPTTTPRPTRPTGAHAMPDPQEPTTSTVLDPSALHAQLAEMQRQLAAERSERIKAEAGAFAEREVRDHRLLPAEAPHYTALYAQLAQDDAAAALAAGSRLDLLRAAVGARPAHTRTTDALGAASAVLAPLGAAPVSDAEAKTKRRQALLSKSADGRAVLTAEKGGR